MYFLLKRFKGAISLTDFYEAWDDDIFFLYRKEVKLVEEELKDLPNNNGSSYYEGDTNIKRVPEPPTPEESQEAIDLVNSILD